MGDWGIFWVSTQNIVQSVFEEESIKLYEERKISKSAAFLTS
jgi:hypothetical protein